MKTLKNKELDQSETVFDFEQESTETVTEEDFDTDESANLLPDSTESADDGADNTDDTQSDIDQDEDQKQDEKQEAEIPEAIELERLRAENQALKTELENAKRLESELADFASIFPEQDVRTIPDEVWQDVKKGNSLSAAFALYERKRMNLQARAEQINQLNAYRSSGKAGNSSAREYFSPDEVRAMSQSEVRANYKKIIESMKRWN